MNLFSCSSGLAYPANPVAPTLPPRYPSYSQNSYQPPAVAMPTLPASVPMNSHSYPYPGVAQVFVVLHAILFRW